MEEFNEISGSFKMQGSLIVKDDSLQRTDEWMALRLGAWNGSVNKDLMGCGRSTSKQPWGSLEKVVDFGAAAEKQVYMVGMERTTGESSMEASAKQMEHGKENEPILIEQLIKDGVITDFKELGSEQFPGYEWGRASVDGVANYKGREIAMELKCCVSWAGHYVRMYDKVHEKHNDFWQHQSEMLATGHKELLYVVTLPMQTKKYDIQLVKASPIHQEELLKRCKIGDRAIELWKTMDSKKEALQVACATFKEENNN